MLLLWLAFRKTDPTELWESLRHADYRYVILSMLMGYAAYISRGMRWLLLLETMNYKPRSWASIHSVAIGYFANMAVPRAGEVARCTSLNKLEDIPVSKLFGTVIVERTLDFIMLISFVSGALLTSYSSFTAFFLLQRVALLRARLLSLSRPSSLFYWPDWYSSFSSTSSETG